MSYDSNLDSYPGNFSTVRSGVKLECDRKVNHTLALDSASIVTAVETRKRYGLVQPFALVISPPHIEYENFSLVTVDEAMHS